jgi:hypothetical protein
MYLLGKAGCKLQNVVFIYIILKLCNWCHTGLDLVCSYKVIFSGFLRAKMTSLVLTVITFERLH